MAISKNAKVTKTEEKFLFYGGVNLYPLPYVNLDNEQKKSLDIRTNQVKIGDDWVEEEKEYVTQKAYRKKEGQTKGELVDVDHDVYEFEFYLKFRNPAKHILTIPDGFEELAIRRVMEKQVFIHKMYVELEEKPASDKGNICFVDDEGNTQWKTDSSKLESTHGFDILTARPAYIGEVELLKYINSLLGFKYTGVSINWNKIQSGDYSDITESLKAGTTKVEEVPDSPLIPEGITFLSSISKSEKDGKVYINSNLYTKKILKGNCIRNYKPILTEMEKDEKMGYPYKGWFNEYVSGCYVYNKELETDSPVIKKEDENLPF